MASVGMSLLGVILLMNQTSPLFVGGGPSDDVLVYLHAFISHVCIYCFTHYTLNTPHTLTLSPSHPHPHTPSATPSPGQSRKQTSLQHKRGSLHLMKKDGKEDPSTFVIREGTHTHTHTPTHTHTYTKRLTDLFHLTCACTRTPLTMVPMLSAYSESASPIH